MIDTLVVSNFWHHHAEANSFVHTNFDQLLNYSLKTQDLHILGLMIYMTKWLPSGFQRVHFSTV